MSEWKEYKIGEVVNYKKGFAFSSKLYQSSGHKIVRVSDTTNDSINLSSCIYISDKIASQYEEYQLDTDDVVIATVGSWANNPNSIVGKVIRVPIEAKTTLLNQNAVRLRSNGKIDNRYLYYVLKNRKFSQFLLGRAQGSANQASITLKDIFSYSFNAPDVEIQTQISSFLYSLDDKIAINRRICENLEAQAQALFKHWFIDFAPFKDSKFVESELGMIPEGWRVGTLGEIADINPTRSLKKGTMATYLDMKNMPTAGSFPCTWEEKEYVGGMKFQNGDTLMARITPCLENGKVAYVNFLKEGEIAFGSTEYIVMTAKSKIFPELLYTLCRFPAFVSYATKNMNGSSGRQRVSGETIAEYKMVIAPEFVYSDIMPLFHDYMTQIRECGFENLRLSTLRDTLLPKLMSGEIKL